MGHLSVVHGERQEFHDTGYLRRVSPVAHPVFQPPVDDAFANRDGLSYAPRWALDVLTLAVGGNPVAIERHGDALEVLAAHLSKLATKRRCASARLPTPWRWRMKRCLRWWFNDYYIVGFAVGDAYGSWGLTWKTAAVGLSAVFVGTLIHTLVNE